MSEIAACTATTDDAAPNISRNTNAAPRVETNAETSAAPGAETSAAPGASIAELRRYLCGLARSLGRGRVDAEDLVQDVFERWLRAQPTLPIGNPRSWMSVVLRHLLFDRLRRERAGAAALVACAALAEVSMDGACGLGAAVARGRRATPGSSEAAERSAAPGDRPQPDRAPRRAGPAGERGATAADAPWWAELDLASIEREVARLSPSLRETFTLFTFQARSYREIARAQAIAEGTVGVRISRARDALRRNLTARYA